MAFLADPIVDALIMEIKEVVEKLVATSGASGVTDDDRERVIRQLCELSRDARFHLGPRDYACADQLSEVAACFQNSVDEIRRLWAGRTMSQDITGYCDNILERARRCREP